MNESGDIVSVLRHYGLDIAPNLGGWRGVKCPFHDDSRASARVSADDGAFACLGCGVKGNSISLIMKVENCDFPSAIELYEKITGGTHPGLQPATRRRAGRIGLSGEPEGFEQGSGFSVEAWLRR